MLLIKGQYHPKRSAVKAILVINRRKFQPCISVKATYRACLERQAAYNAKMIAFFCRSKMFLKKLYHVFLKHGTTRGMEKLQCTK